LSGFRPPAHVLAQAHRQFGRVAPRVPQQLDALASQLGRLAGQQKLGMRELACRRCIAVAVAGAGQRQIRRRRQSAQQRPAGAGGLQSVTHVGLHDCSRQRLRLRCQGVGRGLVSGAHASLDIERQLFQRGSLRIGLLGLSLQGQQCHAASRSSPARCKRATCSAA
jgi:hypothetical protein